MTMAVAEHEQKQQQVAAHSPLEKVVARGSFASSGVQQ
jgi:hypothetical protein